jgi:hypothetical protein
MSVRPIARRLAVALSLATLTTSASLSAQGSAPEVVAAPRSETPVMTRVAPPPTAEPAAGTHARRTEGTAPRRDASVAGVRVQVTADAPRPPALAQTRGRGQTLAIVGGAAFVGGLLIGDDVGTASAVGGLAAAVYGLWIWLK